MIFAKLTDIAKQTIIFAKIKDTRQVANKLFIDGNSLVFNCDGHEFVREIDLLKRKCNVETVSELVNIIDAFLKSNPDEEKVREEFGAGIDDAVLLALNSFYGKKDLDGMPTVLHALEVGRAGETVDEMIVGFIHDVVEDTDVTFDDLDRMGFTRHVISAATLCTRTKEIPYEDYLNRIIESGNKTALNVKLNDLRHNLSRGKKTEQAAILENNTQLLSKIQRINRKHENALETIASRTK